MTESRSSAEPNREAVVRVRVEAGDDSIRSAGLESLSAPDRTAARPTRDGQRDAPSAPERSRPSDAHTLDAPSPGVRGGRRVDSTRSTEDGASSDRIVRSGGDDVSASVADLLARLGRGAARWLGSIGVDLVEGNVVLRVGSAFVLELIERHHRSTMDDFAESTVGRRGAWRVAVDATLRGNEPIDAAPIVRPAEARRRAPMGATTDRSLDDYVVGASNRTAHAAALRLAESDGPSPAGTLFLHGECGVGKTHLILGVCAHRQRLFPDERIRYTTGEQFTNEFLQHLRHGTLDQFRGRMRRVDLLAIDDVHFLAGKSRTSGELLHTLDAIGMDGKRVVIASDGHPEQIRTFSQALRSRLAAGLVVRIDLPDRSLREALVRRLARRRGLSMSDSAVASLVNRCHGSARELEGALNMLAALHELDGGTGPVGHILVERMFEHGDAIVAGPVRPPAILAAVCERLGVARTDPMGSGRSPKVVLARAIFTHLCREMTSLSFPEIARSLQRRTHSTVHAAQQRMERLVNANAIVVELAEEEPITMLDLLDQIRRLIRRAA